MLLEDVSSSITSLQFCKDDYFRLRFLLLSDYPQLKHLKLEAKSLRYVDSFEAVNHASIERIEVGYGCCLGTTREYQQSRGSFCIQNCPHLTSLILSASSFMNYRRFELKSEIDDGI